MLFIGKEYGEFEGGGEGGLRGRNASVLAGATLSASQPIELTSDAVLCGNAQSAYTFGTSS